MFALIDDALTWKLLGLCPALFTLCTPRRTTSDALHQVPHSQATLVILRLSACVQSKPVEARATSPGAKQHSQAWHYSPCTLQHSQVTLVILRLSACV